MAVKCLSCFAWLADDRLGHCKGCEPPVLATCELDGCTKTFAKADPKMRYCSKRCGTIASYRRTKASIALAVAPSGHAHCLRPDCQALFLPMNAKRLYCSTTCKDIVAHRNEQNRRVAARYAVEFGREHQCDRCGRSFEPLEDEVACLNCIEAVEPEPAVDESPCATCAHARPNPHADTGWECREGWFMSCKPYTGAPKHWILRAQPRLA